MITVHDYDLPPGMDPPAHATLTRLPEADDPMTIIRQIGHGIDLRGMTDGYSEQYVLITTCKSLADGEAKLKAIATHAALLAACEMVVKSAANAMKPDAAHPAAALLLNSVTFASVVDLSQVEAAIAKAKPPPTLSCPDCGLGAEACEYGPKGWECPCGRVFGIAPIVVSVRPKTALALAKPPTSEKPAETSGPEHSGASRRGTVIRADEADPGHIDVRFGDPPESPVEKSEPKR